MTTTQPLPTIPIPGERLQGHGTVIASGESDDGVWAVMTLMDEPLFYKIIEVDTNGRVIWALRYDNIVPAAREFDERYGLWGGGG